jgi:hypothetical protein
MELNLFKINEDKLPIKYVLGIQEELENFPDAFDIIHIYVVENINRPSRPQVGFSKASLLKYHANGNVETTEKGIEQAINLGLIEQTKFEEGKETYSIKINPFQ